MFTYSKIKSIVNSYPGLELKKTILKKGDYRIYLVHDNQEKTLFNYIRIDDLQQDTIRSGYFVLQKWWLSLFTETEQDRFIAMSTVKNKDGIALSKFDFSILRTILHKLTYKESIPDKVQKTQAVKKQKGLTKTQAQSVRELNNYTCDSCGVNINLAIQQFPEKGYNHIKDSIIQVHHKVRKVYGKPRNHISNLATLCTICHGEQEGKGHHFQRSAKKDHIIIEEIRRSQNIIIIKS